MNTTKLAIPLFIALSYGPSQAFAGPIMGSQLADFAVLAGSTVTNTGNTKLTGNLGVSPGSAITGFYRTTQNDGPGTFTGTAYQGSTTTGNTAQTQLGNAIAYFGGLASTSNLTGQDLGGKTLTPGVYTFNSTAGLTGTLNLNDTSNGLFVFQIGSGLTTANFSVVNVIGGSANNVYWNVGSSATLGTGNAFKGNILAQDSISLDNGASILGGSAWAHTGAVTMITNTISISAVPEPGTWAMMLGGLGFVGFLAYRRKNDASNMPMPA